MYEDAATMAGAATAFAGVGLCQHRLGAHDDAVASMLRALESARAQKLATLEINIHNSLGSALIAADRIDEAARYLAHRHRARAGQRQPQPADQAPAQPVAARQAARRRARARPTRPPRSANTRKGLAQVTRALELARELGNPYDEAHCLGQTGTMLRLLHSHADADAILARDARARPQAQRAARAGRSADGARLVAASRRASSPRRSRCLSEAIVLARRIAARGVLAEACESLSKVLEHAGDFKGALALYKEFHAVREAELAGSRKHAATAAQLWLDFQDANRRASQYRERAETLAADHAALARKAKVLTEVSEQDPLTVAPQPPRSRRADRRRWWRRATPTACR